MFVCPWICVYICKAAGTGGQGANAPLPPCNDFSIAKVTLFEFTSRGKFLPYEYIDCAVAMLRC